MKKGFTLIEIIITITIVGVLLAVGGVSYSRSIHKNNFQKDIDTVVDLLFLAKQKTISRDVSAAPNCDEFAGFTVSLDPENQRVLMEAKCGEFYQGQTFYDLQNATFYQPVVFDRVEFEAPYGSIAELKQIILMYEVTNECFTVTITTAGLIEKSAEPFSCDSLL